MTSPGEVMQRQEHEHATRALDRDKDAKLASLAMGWSGWGSPVGLSVFLVAIGVFLVCLAEAGILPGR